MEKVKKQELYKLIDNLDESFHLIGYSLVDRMLYLEDKLLELEKQPFYQVNPNNPFQQRELPARKIYVGLMQQYNISLKTLLKMLGVKETDESAEEFKKYLTGLNKMITGEDDES